MTAAATPDEALRSGTRARGPRPSINPYGRPAEAAPRPPSLSRPGTYSCNTEDAAVRLPTANRKQALRRILHLHTLSKSKPYPTPKFPS
ncbi:hypothetical protein NDU88_002225 [Pleurodeles waltl]|uniref:Uncharacterized protein n=1 Tax=Pleurodeles waltl TaxID=8319 RepID=A0AAV7RBA0_PLEWA|nr:hypothetical protein NDU88_002225 [Pleurodeles waltl]